MSDPPPNPHSITLLLPPEEHWTLLDQIKQETMAKDPANADLPPLEVFQAFETLDAGETSFTIPQLIAIQTTLAEYHYSSTWWEIERSRIEQLLHSVAKPIEQHQSTLRPE